MGHGEPVFPHIFGYQTIDLLIVLISVHDRCPVRNRQGIKQLGIILLHMGQKKMRPDIFDKQIRMLRNIFIIKSSLIKLKRKQTVGIGLYLLLKLIYMPQFWVMF